MTVSDNTIQAEGLGDFFKSLGKRSVEKGKIYLKTFSKIMEELLKVERKLVVPLHLEL